MKIGDKVKIKKVDENNLYKKYIGQIGIIIDEATRENKNLKRFFRVRFSKDNDSSCENYIDLGSWRVEKIIE